MEVVKMLDSIPQGYSIPEEYRADYDKIQLEQRRKQSLSRYQPQEEEVQGFQEAETESPIAYLGRSGARALARGAESVIGTGGDLLSLANSLTNWATGGETPFRESAFGAIPLPTSEEVRTNVTKPLTGEYLEPKTYGEKKFDDVIDLTTGLLLGGPKKLLEGGLKGAAKHIAKQAGKAVVAEGLGTLGEELTGSPKLGAGLRVGTLLATSLFGGHGKIQELKEDSYAKAGKLATENKLAGKGTPIENALKQAQQTAKKADLTAADKSELESIFGYIKENLPSPKSKGTGAEAVKSAKKALEEQYRLAAEKGKSVPKVTLKDLVKEQIVPGQLQTTQAMEMLKRVNARYPLVSDQAKPALSNLNASLNNFIRDTGKKVKDFVPAFETGQEIARAEKAVPKILQTINENVNFKNAVKQIKPLSYLMGSIGHVFGRQAAANLVGGLGGVLAGKELANMAYLLNNSPQAFNAWKDFVLAGAKNNTPAMLKAFKNLDREAHKYNF